MKSIFAAIGYDTSTPRNIYPDFSAGGYDHIGVVPFVIRLFNDILGRPVGLLDA